jgi:hypothetical protein
MGSDDLAASMKRECIMVLAVGDERFGLSDQQLQVLKADKVCRLK